jgi:hypothetical protein
VSLTPEQSATLASFLSPGETVLWTGRPAAGVRFGVQDLVLIPLGLFVLAVTGFWIYAAVQARSACLALAVIPGGVLGTLAYAGRAWWSARERAHTVYILTDRHALIMYRASRIRAVDLATAGEVSLDESRDGSGTITFGPFNLLLVFMPAGGAYRFPLFQFLPGARAVYNLILKTQLAARKAVGDAAPAVGDAAPTVGGAPGGSSQGSP